MDIQLFRKLNAIPFKTLKTKKQIQEFADEFKEQGFKVENGKLIYDKEPFKLICPTTEKQEQQILKDLYADTTMSLGRGQNAWYNVVRNVALISRDKCKAFLKSQVDYQMTRPIVKPNNATRKYKASNICWVLDLIDMNQYTDVKDNKQMRYIMTLVDVYNGYTKIKPVKTKSAPSVLAQFKKVCNERNKCKLLISDNGNEFKAELEAYLEQLGIKHITTNTYTPQPHVEEKNKDVRRLISQLFVRNKNLVWLPHLQEVEDNLNYLIDKPKITKPTILTEPNKPEFKVGDRVRIAQHAFISAVRQKYKSGEQKHVHAKWSIHTYKIRHVHLPPRDIVNDFVKYSLSYEDDGEPIMNSDRRTISRFRETDLQLCENIEGKPLTIIENNVINQM